MQYVLLTVTNKEKAIKAFDCVVANDNQYEMRETRMDNGSEIATTIYTQDEYEDFMEVIDGLSQGVLDGAITQLNILRQNGVSQWI